MRAPPALVAAVVSVESNAAVVVAGAAGTADVDGIDAAESTAGCDADGTAGAVAAAGIADAAAGSKDTVGTVGAAVRFAHSVKFAFHSWSEHCDSAGGPLALLCATWGTELRACCSAIANCLASRSDLGPIKQQYVSTLHDNFVLQ